MGISDQEWREEPYRRTRVVVGNSFQGYIGHQVIEEDKPGMEKSLQRLYREKYAELADMKESLEAKEVIIKVGGWTSRRVIYRRKIETGQVRQELWGLLVRLRELLNGAGIKTVTLHQLLTLGLEELR